VQYGRMDVLFCLAAHLCVSFLSVGQGIPQDCPVDPILATVRVPVGTLMAEQGRKRL
jgi:hypothetical protein